MHGPVKGRRAITLTGIDVDLLLDERLYGFRIPRPDRFNEAHVVSRRLDHC
jgi:hypothetical protein